MTEENHSRIYRDKIYLGVGANLVAQGYQTPHEGCLGALDLLAEDAGVEIVATSPWYKTAPVPASDQPWYENAVVEVATALNPEELLGAIHRCEKRFGRVRQIRNEARVLDIDIIDYGGLIIEAGALTLPHPRMHERGFVLLPLADIAPDWKHPLLGLGMPQLLERIGLSHNILPSGIEKI